MDSNIHFAAIIFMSPGQCRDGTFLGFIGMKSECLAERYFGYRVATPLFFF